MQDNIRNFAIIAHIDHGKSTLADRLMEMTGTVEKRDMQNQLLDSNPIERERGITIKLAPVRMIYKIPNSKFQNPNKIQIQNSKNQTNSLRFDACDLEFSGSEYILNLIDTPGHVDFSYEVSRSLAACEGALLVVDATQGVQAQTLANLHQAREHNLTIIPIINKIDLPNARIAQTKAELHELGFSDNEILEISAKTGAGVSEVLEAIVERIPSPQGVPDAATRALVFSSQYDPHKGVVVFVRVMDGSIGVGIADNPAGPVTGILPRISTRGPLLGSPSVRATRFTSIHTSISFLASGAEVTPIEVGYFAPKMTASAGLETGEVGYIATGLKDVRLAKVGDTITLKIENRGLKIGVDDRKLKVEKNDNLPSTIYPQTLSSIIHHPVSIQPLPGYKEPKSMVFVGLFPIEQEDFTKSREAMEKLRLSDSAFTFRPISSLALGNGFHCGFLGLLHAEIVQERLSREFDLSLLATAPSVEYLITLKSGVNPGKAGLVHSSSFLVHGEEITKNQEPGTTNQYSIQSPSEFPDPSFLEEVQEPVMRVTIYSPKRFVGPIMQLTQEKRGAYVDLVYHAEQAEFTYLIPLSEMIVDFFDRLKSVSEGYASLDYEFFDFQPADIVKVDILVNHEVVDALSFLAVKDQARKRGKEIVERLSEVLPRQQFNIPVQAAIGGDIVARGDIKPFRKDVIQKLYGGDRTRKDKLLKKQKKGKERMKRVGSIDIPQNAFFEVLRRK